MHFSVPRLLMLSGVILFCSAVAPADAQSIPGFSPVSGYSATNLHFNASAVAVGPDGKFAVASDNGSGGAAITVYDKFGTGRTAIATFAAPQGVTFKYFGGIAWKDANTFAFSENGAAETVFSASLSGGTITPLAPLGSLTNVADIAYKPGDASGTLYAALANGAGSNAVYKVSGGSAAAFATGIGIGYFGGLAFRPTDGELFVGDTNDPNFLGNAGKVYALDASGSLVQTVSLSGGGGSGIADLTFDGSGNLYATTGATLTRVTNGGAAQNFGSFDGSFPFPTGITFTGGDFSPASGGTGTLLVNGAFTGVGGLFTVSPTAVPEPSALVLFGGFGGGLLLWRRKKITR